MRFHLLLFKEEFSSSKRRGVFQNNFQIFDLVIIRGRLGFKIIAHFREVAELINDKGRGKIDDSDTDQHTYLDVWPGTTCSLAWLVAGCNTLVGGKTGYRK
jgi:hypothetical protein